MLPGLYMMNTKDNIGIWKLTPLRQVRTRVLLEVGLLQ